MDYLYSIIDRKSLALRGLVAVIFGIVALVATGFILDVLVFAFGFFAILSGILTAGVGRTFQCVFINCDQFIPFFRRGDGSGLFLSRMFRTMMGAS